MFIRVDVLEGSLAVVEHSANAGVIIPRGVSTASWRPPAETRPTMGMPGWSCCLRRWTSEGIRANTPPSMCSVWRFSKQSACPPRRSPCAQKPSAPRRPPLPCRAGIARLRRPAALLVASSSIICTSRDSGRQLRVKCPLLHFSSNKSPDPASPTDGDIPPRLHTPQKTSRRNDATALSRAPAAGRRGVEHTMQ